MASVVTIAGSPSHPSRSGALLEYAREFLAGQGLATSAISVRDLNAGDLLHGRYESLALQPARAAVEAANGVILGTPVYKAAYTGVLKLFLDILPSAALAGKIVLPIVTGGSSAHTLTLDYALKPVLAALEAGRILNGFYFIDGQFEPLLTPAIQFKDKVAEQQFRSALAEFAALLMR